MPTTTFDWLPVTTLASGAELRLPLHTLTGAPPGPTLGLSAMVHGNEPVPSIGIIRAVLERLDPAELRRASTAVEDALRGGRAMTRAQLVLTLEAAGIDTADPQSERGRWLLRQRSPIINSLLNPLCPLLINPPHPNHQRNHHSQRHSIKTHTDLQPLYIPRGILGPIYLAHRDPSSVGNSENHADHRSALEVSAYIVG